MKAVSKRATRNLARDKNGAAAFIREHSLCRVPSPPPPPPPPFHPPTPPSRSFIVSRTRNSKFLRAGQITSARAMCNDARIRSKTDHESSRTKPSRVCKLPLSDRDREWWQESSL